MYIVNSRHCQGILSSPKRPNSLWEPPRYLFNGHHGTFP